MNKNLIISILLLCLAGSFYAYKVYNKPHVNLNVVKADYIIKPADWINEFDANEEKALQTYLTKVIELEGTISDIQSIASKTIWVISTGNELSNIQCEMDDRYIEKLKDKFKKGDLVKVQGICSGKLMDIILNQVVCLNEK